MYIAPVNYVLQTVERDTRSSTIEAMVFTLIPFILAVLHLILFGFYREQKQNLFYALCLLGFAGLTYFKYERLVLTDPGLSILFLKLNVVSSVTTIFFGTLTAFSISYRKLPRHWLYFLIGGILITTLGFFKPSANLTGILIYAYFGFSMISISYNSFKSKETKLKGTSIIFVGFVLLAIFIIYQYLD